jgi:acetoacetyl-CoA synthetase
MKIDLFKGDKNKMGVYLKFKILDPINGTLAMQTGTILWQPNAERLINSPWHRFAVAAGERSGVDLMPSDKLHQWSLDHMEDFWDLLWDFTGVIGDKGRRVVENSDRIPGAQFFPDSSLNFAENLLRKTGSQDALVFWGEDKVKARYSHDELHGAVSQLQQYFVDCGIKPGDRIAAMMPNMPEAIIGMLAASSLGAVWSSCSPDFGTGGVVDRFGQIEPRLLLVCDGYWYNSKRLPILEKLREIEEKLPSVEHILVIDYIGESRDVCARLKKAGHWDETLASYQPGTVAFTRLPFAHPLYILFSSGTTGIPKCIVHSQGGTLLQHLKEQQLHCGLVEGQRFFYFTTCGWMMWNWLVSGLASGVTLMLYDGSPFAPDGNILFDYAEREKFNFFGTSAKFIDAVRNAGLKPSRSHDLSSLNMITSTGSPLAPENFRFVYDGIKSDIHLASMSGGTDIVACFVGGIPDKPVRIGEIQGPMLAMAVEVWDDDGHKVVGQKGELVCTNAFPSMPIGFWNDPGDEKYKAAYFARFPGVWCHGDFAEWTENGGMIIHGRSDATLNPQGVRIGTAEIYNQVEQMEEVLEAICIGQDWQSDVRVVLFVRLAEGVSLDDDLVKRIKSKIRSGASPRHVPAKIIAVDDIPRTKSGKITELAVRDIVHGRPVKNQEALANPEALQLYVDLPQLRD